MKEEDSIPRHGLEGRWISDPGDLRGHDEFGRVSMHFRPNGELVYQVIEESRQQVIRLTYRVQGDFLITDQPSSPREDRTRYWFDEQGRLLLDYGGSVARYVRVASGSE